MNAPAPVYLLVAFEPFTSHVISAPSLVVHELPHSPVQVQRGLSTLMRSTGFEESGKSRTGVGCTVCDEMISRSFSMRPPFAAAIIVARLIAFSTADSKLDCV